MPRKSESLLHKIVAVAPGTSVAEAARIMKKAKIGSLLIGTPDKPAGIFTERDLARRVVAEGLDPAATKVAAVMTRKLVTVDSSQSLPQLFVCLARGHFRHLPISEKGRIVGMISLTDMARMLGELAEDEKFLSSLPDEIL